MHIRTPLLLIFPLLAFNSFAQTKGPLASAGKYQPKAWQFIENKNQWEKPVLYRSDFPGGAVFLEQNAITYLLYSLDDLEMIHEKSHETESNFHPLDYTIRAHAFKVHFEGSSLPAIQPSGKYSAYYNYFLGNDPVHWSSFVGAFNEVSYHELYNGINLRYYSASGNLEYDFEVAAGADPSLIKMNYEGYDNLKIENGSLIISTSVINVIAQKPFAYQVIGGQKIPVACNYLLEGSRVKFSFPQGYNKHYPLVIDPIVVASTYSGGTTTTYGHSATYDDFGNIYTGGRCFGMGYPTTTGAFQVNFSGSVDIAISKLNPDGSDLLWATYVGGSSDEYAHSMVTNNDQELCIYGSTASNNYPTSANAYDNTFNGSTDIIVTKLNASGSALIGSTFIGGTSTDGQNSIYHFYGDSFRGEIIGDAAGDYYLASFTSSSNFPVTAGCYDNSLSGFQDACVFKMNSDLSSLVWSTFLGGTGDDAAYGLRLDTDGDLYVTGGTSNNTFPSTAGALNTSFLGGGNDGFVSKLSADGSSLLISTFFGTPAFDESFFIDLDADNSVFIYGGSDGNIPVTPGVYSQPGGNSFITKLDPELASVLVSTRFGPTSGALSPTAFLVDVCNNIYAAGWGETSNLEVSGNAVQPNTDGSDFYLLVLTIDASSLLYATFYGDLGAWDHVDGGTSRFDKKGIVYEAVCAGGFSFPTLNTAWSPNNQAGTWDIAVFKIDFEAMGVYATASALPSDSGCAPFNVQFINNSNGLQSVWDFGDGSAGDTTNAPAHTYVSSGVYNVILISIDSSTCNVSDTAYLTITVAGVGVLASFNLSDSSTCDSLKVQLQNTSTGGLSFNWDFGDGTSATSFDASHAYTIPGTYQIVLTIVDSSSCNIMDTATVLVTLLQETVAAALPSDLTGCLPLNIQFTNSGTGVQFLWDFGDGNTSTLASPQHTYNSPGTFIVTLIATDSSSCNISDTSTFTVIAFDEILVADFSLNQSTGCDSLHVDVVNTSGAGTSYFWDFGDGNTSIQENLSHTYFNPGTYTITFIVTDTLTCNLTDTASTVVILLPELEAGFGYAANSCVPVTVTLDNNTASGTFSWDFGDGNSSSLQNPVYTYNNPGVYTITLVAEDPLTCNVTDTVSAQIVVSGYPVAAFHADSILSKIFSTVHFTDLTTDATSWFWDFGDQSTSDQENPDHIYNQLGEFDVCLFVHNDGGCPDSVCQKIIIEAYPNVHIPNAFSPNNDGVNDVFSPLCKDVTDIHFMVFNRWGELIYETNQVGEGWDGTFRGKSSEIGVYVWYCAATFITGVSEHVKGNVTLIR